MASSYPTSLDTFTNPQSDDPPSKPPHATQHSDANDAIEELEKKVGTGASNAADATTDQILTKQADGTTAWADKDTSLGFRAYRSTAQTLSAATFTTIVFDTEVVDQGADYDSTTGEWTVPETGWYSIGGGISFSMVGASELVIAQVFVNGAVSTELDRNTGGNGVVSGAVPLYLTAGDVVTIRGYRGSAGDVGSGAQVTFFTAASLA